MNERTEWMHASASRLLAYAEELREEHRAGRLEDGAAQERMVAARAAFQAMVTLIKLTDGGER